MTRDEVIARWQKQRDDWKRFHAQVDGAAVADEFLADLVELARTENEAALSLREASLTSGYSVDHLRHLLAAGDLPNVGRKGAPRVRRADLPMRPKRQASGHYDVETDARAIAGKIGARRP